MKILSVLLISLFAGSAYAAFDPAVLEEIANQCQAPSCMLKPEVKEVASEAADAKKVSVKTLARQRLSQQIKGQKQLAGFKAHTKIGSSKTTKVWQNMPKPASMAKESSHWIGGAKFKAFVTALAAAGIVSASTQSHAQEDSTEDHFESKLNAHTQIESSTVTEDSSASN